MSTYTVRFKRSDDPFDHEARAVSTTTVLWMLAEGRLIYAVPTGREAFVDERLFPDHFTKAVS